MWSDSEFFYQRFVVFQLLFLSDKITISYLYWRLLSFKPQSDFCFQGNTHANGNDSSHNDIISHDILPVRFLFSAAVHSLHTMSSNFVITFTIATNQFEYSLQRPLICEKKSHLHDSLTCSVFLSFDLG